MQRLTAREMKRGLYAIACSLRHHVSGESQRLSSRVTWAVWSASCAAFKGTLVSVGFVCVGWSSGNLMAPDEICWALLIKPLLIQRQPRSAGFGERPDQLCSLVLCRSDVLVTHLSGSETVVHVLLRKECILHVCTALTSATMKLFALHMFRTQWHFSNKTNALKDVEVKWCQLPR